MQMTECGLTDGEKYYCPVCSKERCAPPDPLCTFLCYECWKQAEAAGMCQEEFLEEASL